MRVVICPDKFAGTLSAVEAAAAIAEGWRSVAPRDELVLRPVADGGPGFLDVLHTCLGGTLLDVPTTDPLGRPVTGQILIVGATAYVESAQACGLHHLTPPERDPKRTTTFGLATLIKAAATHLSHPAVPNPDPSRSDASRSDGSGFDAAGFDALRSDGMRLGGAAAGQGHDSGLPELSWRKIVVGLGGSGTNDGGAGLLAGLGLPALDAKGDPLPPGAAALAGCSRLGMSAFRGNGAIPPPGSPHFPEILRIISAPVADSDALRPPAVASLGAEQRLGEQVSPSARGGWAIASLGVELVGASDVDNPLTGPCGASVVFGPQKGATASDVGPMDAALAHWATILERDLPGCPAGLARIAGGGAAGGLGAAVLGLGGRIVSGIDLILGETGLNLEVAASDLVITGEGSFDHQSLRGKVIAGVAGAARDHGIPCVVLAGRVSTGRREQGAAGVTEAYALVDHFGDAERAMREPAAGLRALAARLAGQYSR